MVPEGSRSLLIDLSKKGNFRFTPTRGEKLSDKTLNRRVYLCFVGLNKDIPWIQKVIRMISHSVIKFLFPLTNNR